MSVFICSKCGCIENTASSSFWSRGDADPLCSECDPEIGKWHGLFEKQTPDAAGIVERHGELMTKDRAAMLDAIFAYFQMPLPEHIGLHGVARLAFEEGWNRCWAYVEKVDGKLANTTTRSIAS